MTTVEEPEVKLGLRSGIDYTLEDMADALLAQARRERPKAEEDADPYPVLSPGQMARRQAREVYNRNGTPEAHFYSGIYRRAYNPKIHDRPPKRFNPEDANDAEQP